MIDLIFVFILSPSVPVYDVEIVEEDNYDLRLILRLVVFVVDEENFEF
jgi:hypothetical protein